VTTNQQTQHDQDSGLTTAGGVIAKVVAGNGSGSDSWYNTYWANTTDSSKRLNLIVDGFKTGALGNIPRDGTGYTQTWVNITTGISPDQIVDLAGTALISYDVTSIADQLGATDIDFIISQDTPAAGQNATTTTQANVIQVKCDGAVAAGVFDMDDITGSTAGIGLDTPAGCSQNYASGYHAGASTERVGVDGVKDVWGIALDTNMVSYAFKFVHPEKSWLSTNDTCDKHNCYGEFGIAVDIINFDHDNSSKSHNAIYRMEAVETGADTGVFTGTVAYALMNNSTDQTIASGDPGGSSGFTTGGHAGNPSFATSNSGPGITPTVGGSDLVLLLGDGITGTSAPRISYNDSDVTSAGSVIAAQLDTIDHSGTASFNSVAYGDGDTATITITDLDLNQDASKHSR
jgi:hypothetical protein